MRQYSDVVGLHADRPKKSARFVVFGWGDNKKSRSQREGIVEELAQRRPPLKPMFLQQHGSHSYPPVSFTRHFRSPGAGDSPRHTQSFRVAVQPSCPANESDETKQAHGVFRVSLAAIVG